jgi:hypothetical protein
MKTTFWAALAASLLSTNIAAAQSSIFPADSGFYIVGYAELSYVITDSNDEFLGRAELDMGFLPNSGGSSLPIGFSLGIDGFSFDGTTEVALYPALVFALGSNHSVSVGVPRSVVDHGYIPDTVNGRNAFVDLQFSQFTESVLAGVYLLVGLDFGDVYGARYDGVFGNTKVGASYNRIDGGVDADVYSIAFSHAFSPAGSIPPILIFGGIEHLDISGGNLTSYTIGIESRNDKIGGGIKFVDSHDLIGARFVEVYGDYRFTKAITGKVSVLNISGSGNSDTLYGAELEYGFLENGYVAASATMGSNGIGFDDIYEISFGLRF